MRLTTKNMERNKMHDPKSLEELRKLRVAEALKNAEDLAAKEWEALQAKNVVRDFVEKHGGAKATIALIESVYGIHGAKGGKSRRSKRTTITGEIRTRIEKLLRENKTAKAVAEAVGVSVPTVNNHKRLLGLTQPRDAKSSPKPKSAKAGKTKTGKR